MSAGVKTVSPLRVPSVSAFEAPRVPNALRPNAAGAKLPEAVHLATSTQALTRDHQYAVRDGVLWRKPLTGASAWERFGPQNVRVREVLADGDTVLAVDDHRQVHSYQPRFSVGGIFGINDEAHWYSTWGAPEKEALFLPEDLTSFAIGRRSTLATGYMEDPLGNKVKAGGGERARRGEDQGMTNGLTHLYGLSRDGQRLYYADSGLPAAFDRQFDMPKDFRASALAAAGSTVALLGEDGRMFTAFREFDMSGNNPMMFEYTWDGVQRNQDPTNDNAIYELVNLPREPWREQPALPTNGLAEATRNVTLIQTGEGNAARELRVQGRNAKGEYGFWTKPIYDPQWGFRVTGETYSPRAVLSGVSSHASKPAESWFGRGTVKGMGAVKAQIDDFDLTRSPALVTLTTLDGGVARYRLHTVDAWSPLKAKDPGMDGTPKLMLGHLQLVDANAKARPILAHVRSLKDPFEVNVEGTTKNARIWAKGLDIQFGERLPLTSEQVEHAREMAETFGRMKVASAGVKILSRILGVGFLGQVGEAASMRRLTSVAPRILAAHAEMWQREADDVPLRTLPPIRVPAAPNR